VKIALISPKGPLHRHRGGIFKQPLRYAPLALTYARQLHRFYNCDWVVEAGVRPAPAVS
jgi:hypothetical protein